MACRYHKEQDGVTILGRGIHEKVGQEFWYGIARTVAEKFRRGDFTGGIVAGINLVGEGLARHFPRLDSGSNDSPDEDDQGTGEIIPPGYW